MRKLLPVTSIVLFTSLVLLFSKLTGALPENSDALNIIIILEMLLIFFAALNYFNFKITEKHIGTVVFALIMIALLAYVFYSFKLYSMPVFGLLVLACIFGSLILLWDAKEKSFRYYLGIVILGVLGGGLITYRFWDLSWISILLGIMTAILIISLSILLEEEDEKPGS
ncbi:MAG: hypothetical protein KO464_09900 [Candidatus Methanofastidiosum sp.]|nr:hypothetical protein [Methanofastidiosum sp.]